MGIDSIKRLYRVEIVYPELEFLWDYNWGIFNPHIHQGEDL